MSVYTKAASFVLDALWEDADFRQYVHRHGLELADLGPMIPTALEPAYVRFKRSLDTKALQKLELQVSRDLLAPLLQRQSFRTAWAEWDDDTRLAFIREQTELQLAKLLIQVYDQQLNAIFRKAIDEHFAVHNTP
ncbi:MAG: hypothetical protein Kow0077_01910 [Anaerolineae bacterium]